MDQQREPTIVDSDINRNRFRLVDLAGFSPD